MTFGVVQSTAVCALTGASTGVLALSANGTEILVGVVGIVVAGLQIYNRVAAAKEVAAVAAAAEKVAAEAKRDLEGQNKAIGEIHDLSNSNLSKLQEKHDRLEVTLTEMRKIVAALVPPGSRINTVVAAVGDTGGNAAAEATEVGPASVAAVARVEAVADTLRDDVITTRDTAGRIETKVNE